METLNLHIRSIFKILEKKHNLFEVILGIPVIKLELSLKFDF